jgi:hypothetical protein
MVSKRGPAMTGLSAVFWAVRTVFLVILVSKAVEEAFFSSHIILSTDLRLDRRRTMLKDRSYGVV